MTTVGVVANPLAGKDVRRIVSDASPVSDRAKIDIVRRAVVAACDGGAERILVAPDARGLAPMAVAGLDLSADIEVLDVQPVGQREDTTRAAEQFRRRDAAAVIALGGDGTQRDVAKGWLDVPLIPVSTGTNNVFPQPLDPTVAGTAAGLIASGRVGLEEASYRAKVLHVEAGGCFDLALVDVVLVDARFSGSRAVIDPRIVREVVAAIADPAALGLSAIAGRVVPVTAAEDELAHVSCGEDGPRWVRVPILPGAAATVGIVSADRHPLHRAISVHGPGVLSFDGERDRVLRSGPAVITARRDGPWVIDSLAVVRLAAHRGAFLSETRGENDG